MSFGCLQFPPKKEQKQGDLRFHSNKVEFVCSFCGGNFGLKKSFLLFLTFSCSIQGQIVVVPLRPEKCREKICEK